MSEHRIRVLWMSKESYQPGIELEPHSHLYYHCIFVYEGRARIVNRGQTLDALPNCFFLTPPGEPHSLDFDGSGGSLQVVEFKFIVNDGTLDGELRALPSCFAFPDDFGRQLLDSALDEALFPKPHGGEMIHLKILFFLYSLLRMAQSGRTPRSPHPDAALAGPAAPQGGISAALYYMHEHMDVVLTLDELARLCNLSKYYFSRAFKTETGCSPQKYWNQLRMERAKYLMIHSALNITQIAQHTGFESVYHFSTLFKKTQGVSPSDYIRTYNPALYFSFDPTFTGEVFPSGKPD